MQIHRLPALPKGVSHLGGLTGRASGLDPRRLLSRSAKEIKSKLAEVIDWVTPEQGTLPVRPDFGKLGPGGSNTPLIDFLGSLVAPPDKSPEPGAINSSGSQIPGGASLYDTGRGMFHKGAPGAPDTYAFENTPAGIKFAADNGYASIDLDMLITKDGAVVATHWSQPMTKDGFYDPLGKLDPATRVSDMTLAEVMRLRNQDGQSRIYPMSTMIEALKKNGIAGDLEAKNDPRFASDQVMGRLATTVRQAGIRANLKSIDYGPQAYDVLEAAQRQGFWVRTAAGRGLKARHFGYGSSAED